MKRLITQILLTFNGIFMLVLLMGYTKPAPEEAKAYIVISGSSIDELQHSVNEKLAEGWHLQGGFMHYGRDHQQAMAK